MQYICDNCEEIIEEKRWHCSECEEFDLCETCHEDREEPETHSADHDMTAISVAADSDNRSAVILTLKAIALVSVIVFNLLVVLVY